MTDALTPRAVLFDMDGTLVDSDAAVEASWSAWAREYDVDPAEVVRACHGQLPVVTMRQFRPDLSDEQVEAATQDLLARECSDLDGVTAKPGAHEILAALDGAGIPWAVVTSATRELAERRLGAAGITTRLLVPVDEITHGKPDPEGYLVAARHLGVDIGDCVVAEDSPTGLAAGRASGALTVCIAGPTDADADLTCDGLPDLHARLALD